MNCSQTLRMRSLGINVTTHTSPPPPIFQRHLLLLYQLIPHYFYYCHHRHHHHHHHHDSHHHWNPIMISAFGDDTEVFTQSHSYLYPWQKKSIRAKVSVDIKEKISKNLILIFKHWNEMGASKWNAFLGTKSFITSKIAWNRTRRTKRNMMR